MTRAFFGAPERDTHNALVPGSNPGCPTNRCVQPRYLMVLGFGPTHSRPLVHPNGPGGRTKRVEPFHIQNGPSFMFRHFPDTN